MNNNRGNNRRRGRSSGRGGGGGGGQQLNRIDSRARGNAPQLLEKYRKLAQDAHLNGDRVQAEYYLQFADHYFRVIADTRLRQEEQRLRRDDRWTEGADEGDDSADFAVDSDFPTFEQPGYGRSGREDRPRRGEREDDSARGEDGAGDAAADEPSAGEVAEDNPYEPPQNPFVRENRPRAGLRPRRDDRRPRREESEDAAPRQDGEAGLDPASLPPSISAGREDAGDSKPRRARARRKPSADDAGEPLETVN